METIEQDVRCSGVETKIFVYFDFGSSCNPSQGYLSKSQCP